MKVLLKTILKDEKYLRQISSLVDFKDKKLIKDINTLKTYCLITESYALSGVQVGIPKRIIYIKHLDKVLINPSLITSSGLSRSWESCLSCLDNIGLVDRPYSIELEYYDILGNRQLDTFSDYDATIICHELDHLDGILFIDKASNILQMSKDDRKKFRDNHPYTIITKK